jgi:YidC/Oxa1 family membrane protein insertase
VFEFQDENGLAARKEFRFDATSYTLTATISARRGTSPLNPAIQWGPGLGDKGAASGGGSIFTGNAVAPPRVLLHRGGKVERLTPDKAAEAPVQQGPFRFIGVDDHYFVAFVVNDLNGSAEFKPLTLPGDGKTQRRLLAYTLKPAAPAQAIRFYVGPKQFDELQRLGPDYVRAIDFGTFAWLVVPLLGTLKWLYRFHRQLRLVDHPAHHHHQPRDVSAAPQELGLDAEAAGGPAADEGDPGSLLAPEDDRSRPSEDAGRSVGPLQGKRGQPGGRLRADALYAAGALGVLFPALAVGRAARGAVRGMDPRPFGSDPYFVLPALMGLTMFWQQKVTPTSADPAQQRVMMVMPVMFTAMMAFSASGVVLYWFVSQVWAIGQQYLTNWIVGPLPTLAKPPAPAAARQVGS